MHTASYEFFNEAQGISWMSPDPLRAGGVWGRDYRSVGRSVDARGPVDHDSVGLAQARPNKSFSVLWL